MGMTGLIIALITALIFPGIIIRVKSLASGRKGPGILQPWKNFRVLFLKTPVISKTTSFIFAISPSIYFCTILCSLFLIPFPGNQAIIHFNGDFVLLAYLLALGKFFLILNALDTGSSFEGMGANREALYSLLIEPAFFILFATLVFLTGCTSLQEIFTHFQFTTNISFIVGIIAIYVLVQTAMIENSRMPVDDPKTHLELTMIHEVMILDHSGIDLALIHIGTIIKFVLYGTLIANFMVPVSWGFPERISLYIGIQIVFAIVVGLLESFRARKKLGRNPQFILTLSSITLIAFIIILLIKHQMVN
jgi:formate hydrogenlyase subunit 4